MTTSPGLVLLDRDGVINHDSDAYIKTVDEWVPYPDAIEAIARLSRAGWCVAVATNQSGIARGYYDVATLDRMHARLNDLVEAKGGKIAAIAYCPHGPDDACICRKPLPGLLAEIRDRLGLDSLEGAWMVGDSLRDLQAGVAMGCRPALVLTGKGPLTQAKLKGMESKGAEFEPLQDTVIFDDLASFCDALLAGELTHP